MIERDGPEMQLVCDSTGTRYRRTYDRDDFDRMIADAKSDGWLVKVERGEWRHYSPDSRSANSEFAEVFDIE